MNPSVTALASSRLVWSFVIALALLAGGSIFLGGIARGPDLDELDGKYLFMLMDYKSLNWSVVDIRNKSPRSFKVNADLGSDPALLDMTEKLIVTRDSARARIKVYDVVERKNVCTLAEPGIGPKVLCDGRGGLLFTINHYSLMRHDLASSATRKLWNALQTPFQDFGVDRKNGCALFNASFYDKLVSLDWTSGKLRDLGVHAASPEDKIYAPNASSDGAHFSYNRNLVVHVIENATGRDRRLSGAYYHEWSPDGRLLSAYEVMESPIESFNRMSLPIYLHPFEIAVYPPGLGWRLKLMQLERNEDRSQYRLFILPKAWPSTQFLRKGN